MFCQHRERHKGRSLRRMYIDGQSHTAQQTTVSGKLYIAPGKLYLVPGKVYIVSAKYIMWSDIVSSEMVCQHRKWHEAMSG